MITLMKASSVLLMFLYTFTGQIAAPTITAIRVSPDGQSIAVSDASGRLSIIDATTSERTDLLQESGDYISDVSWSPDSTRIVAVSFHGQVSIWSVESGLGITNANVAQNGRGPVLTQLVSASWSPDGLEVAISGQENGTLMLNAVTGERLYYLTTGETYDNAWFPGPNLVTASIGGARTWIGSSAEADDTVRPVTRLAVNREGNLLASKIWDIMDSSSTGATQFRDTLQIRQLPSLSIVDSLDVTVDASTGYMAWSPNSQFIAIGSSDGFVRIWEVGTHRLTNVLYLGNSGRAFDWVSDAEIVYVSTEGALSVVSLGNGPTATPTLPSTPTPSLPLVNGLVAELYANSALEGTPAVTRLDPQVAFNWLLKVMCSVIATVRVVVMTIRLRTQRQARAIPERPGSYG